MRYFRSELVLWCRNVTGSSIICRWRSSMTVPVFRLRDAGCAWEAGSGNSSSSSERQTFNLASPMPVSTLRQQWVTSSDRLDPWEFILSRSKVSGLIMLLGCNPTTRRPSGDLTRLIATPRREGWNMSSAWTSTKSAESPCALWTVEEEASTNGSCRRQQIKSPSLLYLKKYISVYYYKEWNPNSF